MMDELCGGQPCVQQNGVLCLASTGLTSSRSQEIFRSKKQDAVRVWAEVCFFPFFSLAKGRRRQSRFCSGAFQAARCFRCCFMPRGLSTVARVDGNKAAGHKPKGGESEYLLP